MFSRVFGNPCSSIGFGVATIHPSQSWVHNHSDFDSAPHCGGFHLFVEEYLLIGATYIDLESCLYHLGDDSLQLGEYTHSWVVRLHDRPSFKCWMGSLLLKSTILLLGVVFLCMGALYFLLWSDLAWGNCLYQCKSIFTIGWHIFSNWVHLLVYTQKNVVVD